MSNKVDEKTIIISVIVSAIISFLVTLFVNGVSRVDVTPGAKTELITVSKKVDKLSKELEYYVDFIEKNNNMIIEEQSKKYGLITDLSAEGFVVNQTKFGSLLIQLVDAKQYLSGQELSLRIGNLTSATFVDTEIEVGFGDNPENVSRFENVKIVKITKELKASSWNLIKVRLLDVKVDKLKFLAFNIKPQTLKLLY